MARNKEHQIYIFFYQLHINIHNNLTGTTNLSQYSSLHRNDNKTKTILSSLIETSKH